MLEAARFLQRERNDFVHVQVAVSAETTEETDARFALRGGAVKHGMAFDIRAGDRIVRLGYSGDIIDGKFAQDIGAIGDLAGDVFDFRGAGKRLRASVIDLEYGLREAVAVKFGAALFL